MRHRASSADGLSASDFSVIEGLPMEAAATVTPPDVGTPVRPLNFPTFKGFEEMLAGLKAVAAKSRWSSSSPPSEYK
jgi:hypothetical protein